MIKYINLFYDKHTSTLLFNFDVHNEILAKDKATPSTIFLSEYDIRFSKMGTTSFSMA